MLSSDFLSRLNVQLPAIADHFGTPFHIYDEAGIRATCRQLAGAFAHVPFQEYFAVKALPNPHILSIIHAEGFGFDCSSVAELMLARGIGAAGEQIFFTSNNTTTPEFAAAFAEGGAIINLDDISLIDQLPALPNLVCFRYNPGAARTGNHIIGKPEEAKYGLTASQLDDAYRIMRDKGITRFGLHTMLASNERDYRYILETGTMLLERAAHLMDTLQIQFEFLNLGGGLGIPYHPDESPLDLEALADGLSASFHQFAAQYGTMPRLVLESGRYITGSHGALVTRAVNYKSTYREYIGVDASMSALMRPAMYGAYHHIDVVNASSREKVTVDVVGSLCENNDKFAIQRLLPRIATGDLLIIHDTGAHGHAMGFNYNGKLRPKELLLRENGRIDLIRRAETVNDYFATLQFAPDILQLS